MGNAVKKTISLPRDMAREIEEMADEQGKSVSAVIQDAVRLARKERLRSEFSGMQGYWSTRAREKGILTERDLKRYLEKN